MTAGIVMVTGLFIPLYSVINRAVYKIRPSWDFDISLYLPDGNIALAGIHASSEILIRASVVGAAFAVVCGGSGGADHAEAGCPVNGKISGRYDCVLGE